jgi:carbamoyl-phosphate synthase large subunit
MDKIVVLISAIYGDIGCSAVRLLREAAKKIVGCDIKPYSPVSHLVDQFYIAPAATDTTNYMAFLKEIIIREKIDFFLPVSEPEIEVLNTRRKELEVLGVKLLLNNQSIIDNFLDKLKTVQYLEGLNIRVPRTMLLSGYDGSYGYPVIVKSMKSHGSKNLQKVIDMHDLEYISKKNDGSLLIQECIGSNKEEYTTGVFSDGDIVSSITFRRKLGFGSMSIEAILVDEPYLHNIAQHIARDMALIGSINIQSRRVGNDFIVFEINPRLSSTMLFRKKFGFDDAVWWLSALLGKGYFYQRKFKSGRAARSLTECYFDMEELDFENR